MKHVDERRLGEKGKVTLNNLEHHGSDLIKIFSLHDKKKRAKTELIAVKLKYEEACSALQKKKECLMRIFGEMNSNDNNINGKD